MDFSDGCLKILDYANACNIKGSIHGHCVPFVVNNQQVGLVPPKVVEELINYPKVFHLEKDSNTNSFTKVTLEPNLDSFESRSQALVPVLEEIRKKNLFIALKGWRDECYDVHGDSSQPPVFKMERSATGLFGTKQQGVHINGYTNDPNKGLCMWIAKRSMTKQTFPGKLDQMVAGGLSSGLGIRECAIKEAHEEASVPDHLLTALTSTGMVSYFYEDERGLFPECQYLFDLELPADFEPVNTDGEAESFQLLTMEELKPLVISDTFKFNCALIVVDFMVRHGIITPDTDPNYKKIVLGLRTPHPF